MKIELIETTARFYIGWVIEEDADEIKLAFTYPVEEWHTKIIVLKKYVVKRLSVTGIEVMFNEN